MQKHDIHNLFEYTNWANDVLLSMLAAAFGEDTDLRSSGDALTVKIQETAVHIVGAQQIWRMRWMRLAFTAVLDPANYPSVSSLRQAFREEEKALWPFLERVVSEEQLAEVYEYENLRKEKTSMALAPMIQHVVNHGTYHRGQITARLMDLGYEDQVKSTDYAAFILLKAMM